MTADPRKLAEELRDEANASVRCALLREAAAWIEWAAPAMAGRPGSVQCAWCASALPGERLHSGDTLRCPECSQDTVVDTWKPKERARFYAIVERAREPLETNPLTKDGPPLFQCRLRCKGDLWSYHGKMHAPDCPLRDAARREDRE